MARVLNCPCGLVIRGQDDDDLVDKAQEHLSAEHPGRTYTADEILFLAM